MLFRTCHDSTWALLLAAVAVSASVPGSCQAANTPDLKGRYQIISLGNGKAWYEDGENMIRQSANPGRGQNSVFTLLPTDDGKAYRIRNEATRRLVYMPADGDLLAGTWKLTNEDAPFEFEFQRQNNGGFRIVATAPRRYVTSQAAEEDFINAVSPTSVDALTFFLVDTAAGRARDKVDFKFTNFLGKQVDFWWHPFDGSPQRKIMSIANGKTRTGYTFIGDRLVMRTLDGQLVEDFLANAKLVQRKWGKDPNEPVALFPEQYTVPLWIDSVDTSVVGKMREVRRTDTSKDYHVAFMTTNKKLELGQMKGTRQQDSATGEEKIIRNFAPLLVKHSADIGRGSTSKGKTTSTLRLRTKIVVVPGVPGSLKIQIWDDSSLHNQAYADSNEFAGFFLERATIAYETDSTGWDMRFGPLSQNKTAGYNHDSSVSVDVGLEGLEGTGSVGWSESKGSGGELADIEYKSQLNPNGKGPLFTWWLSNMYDEKMTKPVAYASPEDAVRRDIVNEIDGILQAPTIAQTSFDPAAYASWVAENPQASSRRDFVLTATYRVTHREIHTRKLSDENTDTVAYKDAGRVFVSMFKKGWVTLFTTNVNDMKKYYYTTRDWGSSSVTQEFIIRLTIPKAALVVPAK